MASDPHVEYPERKRLRVANYDYTSAGYYFVTLVTESRACLFGSIAGGEMRLNPAGQMVEDIWQEMPDYYDGVDLDVLVVMPNHLHGIVVLGNTLDAGDRRAGTGGRHRGPAPTKHLALSEVLKRFKSLTLMRYGIGVRTQGWGRYPGSLWQRSYHEWIIRNDRELAAVRRYIVGNPQQWHSDRENADRPEDTRSKS